MIHVMNNGPARALNEPVFFPYDTYNIPLLAGLSTNLIPASKHPEPVVRFGGEGEVDQHNLRYFGSVIKVDGRYHMWYLGGGDGMGEGIGHFPAWRPHGICYAVGDDGISWEKPSLGLVEYNGNRNNNLVDLDCAEIATCVVIHDPEDPYPDRRFKIIFDSTKYGRRPSVAFSPDGLRWRPSDKNPVLPYRLEMSGLIRLGDAYYCNGQAAGRPPRMLCTVMSYDFENWTTSMNVGLRRDNISGRPRQYNALPRRHFGPQVHLGASLWDRGNTILGTYGIWDCPDEDRNSVYMDLGLVVTTDAVHYDEPVPDFGIVPAGEEPDGATPALMQGQGYENIRDRTMFWYSAWREGEVRLATWERDRLGYASVEEAWGIQEPHLWTCPFLVREGRARVFLNVNGIGEHNRVSVAAASESFEPLERFGAQECGPVENGLRSRVRWTGGKIIAADEPLRLQINIEGPRARDVRLYSAYVKTAE